MYQYKYIEATSSGFLKTANHRELIDKYSQEGWRFVTAIPVEFKGYGVVKRFDLVFEKKTDC